MSLIRVALNGLIIVRVMDLLQLLGASAMKRMFFVHHSGIKVGVEQYKYLVQGEYIQFNLRSSDNENHPFQADNIRGINNGKLMCETHLEIKKQRDSRELTDDRVRDNGPSQNVRKNARERIRAHGGGPREGDQWFLVKRGSRGREKGKVYKEANQVTTNEGVINN